MSFNLQHNPELEVVEVRFSGQITVQDVREVVPAFTSIQKQTGALRFLVDACGCTLAVPYFEILDLPNKHFWEQGFNRESRVAIILPDTPSIAEAARFFETACQNRGWQAKVFPNRQEAMDWLRRGHESARPEDTRAAGSS